MLSATKAPAGPRFKGAAHTMILSCPSCRARYVVPDSAVGATGRKVRCANCRFSWFQDGHEVAPPPASAPAVERDDRETVATRQWEPVAAEPMAQPAGENSDFGGRDDAAPEPRLGEPEQHTRADPDISYAEAEPSWSQPDDEAPPRPRRNPARMLTIVAALAAIIMLGAVALLYTVGLPGITQRLGLAADDQPVLAISGTATPERLPTDKLLLTVNGQIRNMTDAVQRVPQIRADVIDGNGRSLYSWSIAPPVAQLAPGGTATFNSASTDVPPGGRNLSLSFAPMT